MMPTLSTAVGGADRTFSAILVGVGAGAIVGTITVSMLGSNAALGRALAIVGVGSGLAMVVIGFATTPVMAVTGGMLAGGTRASYMALSATFVQRIVPDELRGRVMALYVMLAAGHMAFVNLGFGLLADGIGVRVLLIVPGLIWIAAFLAAAALLPEVRTLLRSGDFRPRVIAPAAVAIES
jgi:MFS family permease